MSGGGSSLPVDTVATVDSELLKQELESRYAYYGYVPVILIIKAHGARFKDENGVTLYKEIPCYKGISLNKLTLVPRACKIKTTAQFLFYLSRIIEEFIKPLLYRGVTFEVIMQHSQKKLYELFEELFVKYYKENDISSIINIYPRWQQILLRANGIGEPLKEDEIEEYKSIKMTLFEFNSCIDGNIGLYDKKFTWYRNCDKTRADDSDYVRKQKRDNNIFVSFAFETQIVAAARELKEKKISRKYDFDVYRQASKMLKEYHGIIPPRQGESFNWDELGKITTLGWIYNLYVGYGYNDITIIDLSCDVYSCEGDACRGGRKAKKSRKNRKGRKGRKSKRNKKSKKNKRIK
jgi:hypothetical protein